jgi:hypothetical protein
MVIIKLIPVSIDENPRMKTANAARETLVVVSRL